MSDKISDIKKMTYVLESYENKHKWNFILSIIFVWLGIITFFGSYLLNTNNIANNVQSNILSFVSAFIFLITLYFSGSNLNNLKYNKIISRAIFIFSIILFILIILPITIKLCGYTSLSWFERMDYNFAQYLSIVFNFI